MSEAIQMELAGQIAIVTGAAQGIGKAIALSLAQRGADLVLVGRRLEAIESLAEVVRGDGRRAHLIRCDVTEGDQIRAMVGEAAAQFNNRIDILVNTVGGTGSLGVPIWEISEKSFAEIMTLNLTSCFLTMATVLPLMIARRSGRIVSIAGTFGLRGRAGRAAYSAAKWGLRGLTKSAALEAGPYNVTVNCVCPGMVEGPRFDEASAEIAARDGIAAAEAKTRIAQGYPLRRASTPQDIANMVVFLAGEGGRQITGQDLAVDGGWSV